jgi:predicted  nucleic acid-binding Zn-ribbon protein
VDDAAQMYELQRVDLTWIKVAKRLQQLQQLLGESERLRNARGEVAQTEETLHSLRAAQRNAELESKSLAERISDTEHRLMSGAVRSPKELESLQLNLDSLRRHREQVEEQAMTAMLQAEQAAGELAERKDVLATIESEWRSSQGSLLEEEAKLKHNFALLKRKRESLAQAMGATLLERYETMRKRKGGVAVAMIENGICAACHVKIPTGIVNGLRGGSSTLVLCPSCGRYLHSA